MKKLRLSTLLIDFREKPKPFISNILKEIDNITFNIDEPSSPEKGAKAIDNKAYGLYLFASDKNAASALDLLRLVRKSGCKSPIIVLTDTYDYQMDMEVLQAGGSDFLAIKELSPEKLSRSILYSLKNHNQTDIKRYREDQILIENSERPFRTLIEQSPLSIMIFSTKGTINFMNEASEKLFGIEQNQISNYNILKDKRLIEKGAMTYVKRAFSGETSKVPAIKYHPAGDALSSTLSSDRWIHSFMYPVKDENGSLSEVIVMHEDVTVSKESEEATLYHLRYLDAMERINSVSIKATSVNDMLKNVLNEMLSIFQCDRTWLLYPCDPQAESWRVPMEAYKPEWPGANVDGIDIPMDEDAAGAFQAALDLKEPLVFDANTGRKIPTGERFHIKSQVFMSIFPKTGSPWLLGLHHCANAHLFSKEEIDIFNGFAHRVGEAITSFLTMQNLKESEERFRTLVENAPEAIVVYDVDKKKYVDANNNALNLFKRSYDDLMQISPLHTIPRLQPGSITSINRVKENIEKALCGETPLFEWNILDSKKNEIPCEIRLAHLPATGKQLIRGSITDITGRKKAEERLRQLSRAVEQSPASLIITDVAGIIEYVNPKFTEVTGYSFEETIGKKPNILKSGEHSPDFYSHLWKTITNGDEWRGELLNRNKKGKLFWERASISPIVDNKGITRNYLAVKEDITEKIKLENDAMRAAHLASLGELAAGVAHEINNPINSIINFSQILADKNKNKATELDICNRMIKEGKRIASIVSNLLSFARESDVAREPVFIADILSDTLALCRLQMEKAHIKIDLKIPKNLPPLIANRHQLQQVFLNLTNNAQYALNEKFGKSKKGKKLKISARKVTTAKIACLRLIFHDNGTGIPALIKGNIMDPFFSTKPTNKGTGLGLSISHGIIEDHEGKLTFHSTENEFTKAIIDLPLANKKNGDPGK